MVLAQYVEGATWSPESLTPGQAALEALACALQGRDRPEQALGAITTLVRNAGCYRGQRGAAFDVSAIRELLDAERLSEGARA